MKFIYKSYLRAFHKYARYSLTRISSIKTITRFAKIINIKANQLLRRAFVNNIVELPRLQKDLFESGRDYVRRFAHLLKQDNAEKRLKRTRTPDKNLHPLHAEMPGSPLKAVVPAPETNVETSGEIVPASEAI